MHAINVYSPAEQARVRSDLQVSGKDPEGIEGGLTVADRWNAPDTTGLWLATMYVQHGHRIPAHLDPSVEPSLRRFRSSAMSPSQDSLLNFIASTAEADNA